MDNFQNRRSAQNGSGKRMRNHTGTGHGIQHCFYTDAGSILRHCGPDIIFAKSTVAIQRSPADIYRNLSSVIRTELTFQHGVVNGQYSGKGRYFAVHFRGRNRGDAASINACQHTRSGAQFPVACRNAYLGGGSGKIHHTRGNQGCVCSVSAGFLCGSNRLFHNICNREAAHVCKLDG